MEEEQEQWEEGQEQQQHQQHEGGLTRDEVSLARFMAAVETDEDLRISRVDQDREWGREEAVDRPEDSDEVPSEDQRPIPRFIATVETEHARRISRLEREEAVVRAVGSLANSDDDDDDPRHEVQTGLSSLEPTFTDQLLPPPIPPRHPARRIMPTIEDMMRERLEIMSVYSDDSMSDVSYTTADMERDLENAGRKGKGLKAMSKGKSKLLRAGKSMQLIASRVEKKVGRPLRKAKMGKSSASNNDANMEDDDDDDDERNNEEGAGAGEVAADPSTPTNNNARTPGAGSDSGPGMSALRVPVPSLFPLPIQPPNTPTTPTTPLTFARHSIPTIPDWNASPIIIRSRLTGAVAASPDHCSPLRMHPDVMGFAEPPSSPEALAVGVEALEERQEGGGEERSQVNELFFGAETWNGDLRGKLFSRWEEEVVLGRRGSS